MAEKRKNPFKIQNFTYLRFEEKVRFMNAILEPTHLQLFTKMSKILTYHTHLNECMTVGIKSYAYNFTKKPAV